MIDRNDIYKEEPCHSFDVKFRDVEHFNKVVRWMLSNVGKARSDWTIAGRVKRSLDRGRAPVVRKVIVFSEDFERNKAEMLLNLF